MVTLDQAIDAAMQLPPEQQEMLMEILHKRQIEARRQKIADDAQKSLADFREGKLKPQSALESIEELRQVVEDEA